MMEIKHYKSTLIALYFLTGGRFTEGRFGKGPICPAPRTDCVIITNCDLTNLATVRIQMSVSTTCQGKITDDIVPSSSGKKVSYLLLFINNVILLKIHKGA